MTIARRRHVLLIGIGSYPRIGASARLLGPVNDVRAMGYRMYVTDARCRYMFPLAYDEEFQVSARVTATRPLLRIAYEVRNLTHKRKAARAFTVLATTDGAGNLLTETPDDVVARLPAL